MERSENMNMNINSTGEKVIFHVDVNSAFLSWTAVDRLKKGEVVDLRNIPSIIGGDEKSRHGVVLAKSVPAKRYGIVTGESLYSARKKCPELIAIPPCFELYSKCSNMLMGILREYTDAVSQYSIDESFMDVTDIFGSDPVKSAVELKDRIKDELGFTVNVGISSNRLLAKMASELKKPDMVHTLYLNEISKKMWTLEIGELFMVGKRAKEKLNAMHIYKIGDLAQYDVALLEKKFKSYGILIWQYANGIDNSEVSSRESDIKCISNSTTIAYDIKNREEAHKIILSLADNVSSRLRKSQKCCTSVSVNIKNSSFINYSHQKKLISPTDSTKKIAETAIQLFDEGWRGDPVRLLGISLSQLTDDGFHQMSFFDSCEEEKEKKLDKVIDNIREKYGENALVRSSLLKNK